MSIARVGVVVAELSVSWDFFILAFSVPVSKGLYLLLFVGLHDY